MPAVATGLARILELHSIRCLLQTRPPRRVVCYFAILFSSYTYKGHHGPLKSVCGPLGVNGSPVGNHCPRKFQNTSRFLANSNNSDGYTQGHRNGGTLQGHCPPALWKGGQRGHRSPSHSSIISNSMIYQDRLETNLLKLFRSHIKFRIV